MFFVVSYAFYYILYAREDGQLFTIDNHINVLVFLTRINQAQNELKEIYIKPSIKYRKQLDSKLNVVKWDSQTNPLA